MKYINTIKEDEKVLNDSSDLVFYKYDLSNNKDNMDVVTIRKEEVSY